MSHFFRQPIAKIHQEGADGWKWTVRNRLKHDARSNLRYGEEGWSDHWYHFARNDGWQELLGDHQDCHPSEEERFSGAVRVGAANSQIGTAIVNEGTKLTDENGTVGEGRGKYLYHVRRDEISFIK